MKKFFRRINNLVLIPQIFLIFFLKITIYGAGIGDAIASIALCSLFGYYLYLRANKFYKNEKIYLEKLRDMTKDIQNLKAASSAREATLDQKTKGFFKHG